MKQHRVEFETTQLKPIKWIGELGRVGCVSTSPGNSKGFLLGLRSWNLHSTLFGMQTHFDSDGPMGSPDFFQQHLVPALVGLSPRNPYEPESGTRLPKTLLYMIKLSAKKG